jgi:outer membrane immunogenic protein
MLWSRTGVAAFVLASVVALASPISAQAQEWKGAYAGVYAGYGWGDNSVKYTPNDINMQAIAGGVFSSTFPGPASITPDGAVAGLQLGYNFRLGSNLVLGVEADLNMGDVNGSGSSFLCFACGVGTLPGNALAEQEVKLFGTVRGRVGWLLTKDLLLYGTYGFAYAKVEESVVFNSGSAVGVSTGAFAFNCTGTGANCFTGNSSRTATGRTFGGGVEFALTKNVTLRGDYTYMTLDGDTFQVVAVNGAGSTPSSATATVGDLHLHVLRAGLNLKF